MAQYTEVLKHYFDIAIRTMFVSMEWDRIATRQNLKRLVNTDKGTTAYFSVYETQDGTTTPLGAGAAALTTMVANEVPIALYEYGEGYIKVPANANFTAPYDVLEQAVIAQSEAATNTMNSLAKTQALDTIPASGNYTHALNNSGAGGAEDVHTAGYVYLGTGATTKATRNLITTGEIFDATTVRKSIAKLRARKTMPFAVAPNGEKLYACFLTSLQLADLKDEVGESSFTSTNKYLDGAQAIKYGGGSIWEGAIFFPTDEGIVSAAGLAGQDIHQALFCGANFIAKGFRPAKDLVNYDPSIQTIPLFESVSIKLAPIVDPHGRYKSVVYHAVVGFGILDPRASLRVETSVS